MQLPPLSEIEKIRKKLGLTQTELAEKANVSQSLIARVESSTVDPRFSKIVQIFRALDALKGKEIEAINIITSEVVGIQKDVSIEYAASKLREYGVSQMPVFDGENIVGSFSEKVVLEIISGGYDARALPKEEVSKHMDSAFPQINPDTPLSVVSSLLEHNSAVLVHDMGKTVGIITKADLLKVLK